MMKLVRCNQSYLLPLELMQYQAKSDVGESPASAAAYSQAASLLPLTWYQELPSVTRSLARR